MWRWKLLVGLETRFNKRPLIAGAESSWKLRCLYQIDHAMQGERHVTAMRLAALRLAGLLAMRPP